MSETLRMLIMGQTLLGMAVGVYIDLDRWFALVLLALAAVALGCAGHWHRRDGGGPL